MSLAVCLLYAGAADGSIESADDPVFGPGSIAVDTDTGLEWLDLGATVGLSYDEVVAQTGVGGTFEGFRYAMGHELSTFFTNLGLVPNGAVSDGGAAANAAVQLLGQSAVLAGTVGLYDDGGDPASVDQASIHFSIFPPRSVSSIGGKSRSTSFSSNSVGSWLVREADGGGGGNDLVPEPAGIAVWSGLLVAAVGMAILRRRNIPARA